MKTMSEPRLFTIINYFFKGVFRQVGTGYEIASLSLLD
jgi:hypothetical protein